MGRSRSALQRLGNGWLRLALVGGCALAVGALGCDESDEPEPPATAARSLGLVRGDGEGSASNRALVASARAVALAAGGTRAATGVPVADAGAPPDAAVAAARARDAGAGDAGVIAADAGDAGAALGDAGDSDAGAAAEPGEPLYYYVGDCPDVHVYIVSVSVEHPEQSSASLSLSQKGKGSFREVGDFIGPYEVMAITDDWSGMEPKVWLRREDRVCRARLLGNQLRVQQAAKRAALARRRAAQRRKKRRRRRRRRRRKR